jgi:hypothetical protein
MNEIFLRSRLLGEFKKIPKSLEINAKPKKGPSVETKQYQERGGRSGG